MATILSLPLPNSLLLSRRPSHFRYQKLPHKFPTVPYSLSPSLQTSYSIVTKEDEEQESSPSPSPSPESERAVMSTEDPQFKGCKACGREEIEKGCNGEGRIQGGIATVPGFGWWPIKAYRPCPGFVASGGRYRRRGQSMDEVAFGRGQREMSVESIDKAKSSKKKMSQGPKR
ncbi:uncharacterized protein [Typha latifolia]|uniref:uncharacterized protein n=1 Tax=Typha latifolia TaxID=4733 RepID=UPI003C2E2D83